ncbi:hypothetical protein CPC08DRAFT_224057 [Agrocybe pediades]|nr:hypothetical protein CPC08DRAFT_224057 [Agrocybe pediades]
MITTLLLVLVFHHITPLAPPHSPQPLLIFLCLAFNSVSLSLFVSFTDTSFTFCSVQVVLFFHNPFSILFSFFRPLSLSLYLSRMHVTFLHPSSAFMIMIIIVPSSVVVVTRNSALHHVLIGPALP